MRDLGKPRSVAVGPLDAVAEAPAGLVFEMLSAIGQAKQPNGERSTIIGRHGERLVCEFWTLVRLPIVGARLVRTREEVSIEPPATIRYQHLDGPLRDLRETITLEPLTPRRTLLRYQGAYEPRNLLTWLGVRLVRPLFERTMAEHFAELARRAKARADRSRVYRAT